MNATPTPATITARLRRLPALGFARLAELVARLKPTARTTSTTARKPAAPPTLAHVAKPASMPVRKPAASVPTAPRKPAASPRLVVPALIDPDAELADGGAPVIAARERERARCQSIMESPAGMRNPTLAAGLAFTTRMPRAAALAMLARVPAPPSLEHPQRAARNPNVGVDAPAAVLQSPKTIAVARMHRAIANAVPAIMRRP